MLILIAGISGNVGQHAAQYALSVGHRVRGLGRSPTKLPLSISSKLESFVTSSTWYDVPALEASCAPSLDGSLVDAVICAYAGLPELHLDGQLLLLRAAERAGIKRFLAASWNYDWRNVPFQSEPVYDPAMMFHAQVSISSSIKPLHIFSGMLVEVFFGAKGQVGFGPEWDGVWESRIEGREPRMEIYGTGNEPWQFTTERDAGSWAIEVVAAPNAEDGGYVSLCSFEMSLNELKRIYEKYRGIEVPVTCKGTAKDLLTKGEETRLQRGRAAFWEWHRYIFHGNCVTGVWNMKSLQNEEYPAVQPQDLEEFLKENPEV